MQKKKKRIEASIKASHRPVSNHSIARVLENVHTHIARVAEAGVALQTHTGLLRVNLHVQLQGGALTEALRALVALVGPLPGVSPHVGLQAGFQSEELHAFVALEGLLPGVSPRVDLQVAFLLIALHALVTLEGLLPGVSPHVVRKVAFTWKALLALVAPVRLLALVGTLEDGCLGIVG